MLRLRRAGWRSATYEATDGGRVVARIGLGASGGRMEMGDTSYAFDVSGDGEVHEAVLREGQNLVARGCWRHGVRPEVEVMADSRLLFVEPAGCLDRQGSVSTAEGTAVGSIRRNGTLASTVEADLLPTVPLPVRLFLASLMILIWRQLDEEAALVTVTLGGV